MTAAPQRQPGVMIAMFDIPEALDEEFNAWYDEEHIPEKVGRVPGFLRARRYKALDGRPNYLAVYELEDISVIEDSAYLANYRSATSTTERMKAKAKTFYRNVYVQIGDFHGIPLPGEANDA
ncbi:hypothetical protein ABZS66_05190 [Dactylosporangium sp. NPDC005572]|uniref:hypothetical protein n=1 Tax=Dactylosporangium sp. NPDC005572 TaxID=3156889 RepID=UPI0033B14B19